MKYRSLEQELIRLIEAGEGIAENGQFLTERAISKTYQVSRNTVHKAISELCKQGYLMQLHGRGTFIKNNRNSHPITSITACTQNYKDIGYCPSQKLLAKRIIPATRTVASNLKIEEKEPVLYMELLYFANRMVLNETISYIPLSRFPHVEIYDFTTAPLLDVLQAHYGACKKETTNTIEAIHPPAEIAKNMDIPMNTPIILFDSVTSGIVKEQFVPFEYFRSYYKTDFLRFGFTQRYE